MWGSTRIPSKIYQVLYPFKRHFHCAQAQHFLVCCWMVIALMRAPGKGTLKGLRPYLPAKLPYWTIVRMVRSGQWDAQAVITDLAAATLRSLPPPTDGVLYLIGDSTLKRKTSKKRLRRALVERNQWLRQERHAGKRPDLWQAVARKMRGPCNYFGVTDNSRALWQFREAVCRLIYKWLNPPEPAAQLHLGALPSLRSAIPAPTDKALGATQSRVANVRMKRLVR
jgi:hypothetical protein